MSEQIIDKNGRDRADAFAPEIIEVFDGQIKYSVTYSPGFQTMYKYKHNGRWKRIYYLYGQHFIFENRVRYRLKFTGKTSKEMENERGRNYSLRTR